MNNNFIKVLAIIIIFALVESCNETLVDENIQEEIELKSANTNKKGYIVVLSDAGLNAELNKLKGYEKKQLAVKSKSQNILKRVGISDGEIGHVYGTAIKGFSVKIAPGQLKKLQEDPSVKYIEEDKVISLIKPLKRPDKPGKPNDEVEEPPVSSNQEIPWGIKRVNGGADGSGLTAWIIDSGIDLDHPDLNVDKGTDNKNRSFLSGKQSSNPDDQNGHGTHVAGTIAALNNSYGVIGVAAGAKVISVRVLDRRGSGYTSGVVAGVDYVAANASPSDVANMSLGGGVSSSLDIAVKAAANSCKFILAAGNESDDADNHSPARVDGNSIFTIAAIDINDQWASFSNYGIHVDYCAPGRSIKSTWKNAGYNTISGTSMAAPHVAGILLLGPIIDVGTAIGVPNGTIDIIASH